MNASWLKLLTTPEFYWLPKCIAHDVGGTRYAKISASEELELVFHVVVNANWTLHI